jgi:hypothetical protein
LLGVGLAGAVVRLGFFDNVVPVASEHGVGLATSSLTVSENGDVVAGNDFLEDGLNGIENLSLSAFGAKDSLQVLFSDLSRQVDLNAFLNKKDVTESLQRMDSLKSDSELSNGLILTMVAILTNLGFYSAGFSFSVYIFISQLVIML